MSSSYRRPSFAAAGGRATVFPGLHGIDRKATKDERHQARLEERSLLRDNNVIPPKHPRKDSSRSIAARVGLAIPGGKRKVVRPDEDAAGDAVRGGVETASEHAPLLGDPDLEYGGQTERESLNRQWESAVVAGKIKTTWQREAKVISQYSAPLIATFLLQYSLTVASIFTVGHLGTVELGAVSLASMTANITGYAVYHGLATSLDTLCAQAYGSGRRKLVGLQMQRMVYFLWVISIPIGIIWLSAEPILVLIVPEKEVAVLAGLYLRIVLIGAPGYAAFESGKRFLQAQGLFSASLYVLIICAPLNALMNYLFVWVRQPLLYARMICLLSFYSNLTGVLWEHRLLWP
jgi:MATE family multidrug resistance protein